MTVVWLLAAGEAGSLIDTVVGAAGIAGIVVVAFGVGNSRRKSETIKAQQELIDTYEQREELHARRLSEFKEEHDRQIAELRGRLDVLQSDWARDIADHIARAIADAVLDPPAAKGDPS